MMDEKQLSTRLPYRITATVVHGNHLGRTIGFPTANLGLTADNPFLPAPGVYAARVYTSSGVFPGMTNAGFRPTIEGKSLVVEVHLLDFSGDLYGQEIELELIARIRDEKKFESLEHLKAQLQADAAAARLLAG